MQLRAGSTAVLIALAIIAPALPTLALLPPNTPCEQLLMNITTTERVVDGHKFGIFDYDAEQLADVLDDVSSVPGQDAVVYCPVRTLQGVAMLRIANPPGGGPVGVALVNEPGLERDEVNRLLKEAREPLGIAARERLRALLLSHPGDDHGRPILLADIPNFGLSPADVGIDHATIFASRSVAGALGRVRLLSSTPPEVPRFSAILGYPRNESDLAAMFPDPSQRAPLSAWNTDSSKFTDVAREHNVRLVDLEPKREHVTAADVLAPLAEADGIVFVVAHAHGCRVRLPGGDSISVSPHDISSLRLIKSPFGVVRICDGHDVGFGHAFLEAGASGVWINRGPITADQANKEVDAFLTEMNRRRPVIDAIRTVEAKYKRTRTGSLLLTQKSEYHREDGTAAISAGRVND